MQSNRVQPNWAEENLQVIRTLMERAGLYRRALAPVMFSAGLLGLVAAVIGNQFDAIAPRHKGFLYYWTVVCAFALVVVSSIIRRQAVRDGESFWTAPMKRVTQSLLPHFAGGALLPVRIQRTWLQAMGWVLDTTSSSSSKS